MQIQKNTILYIIPCLILVSTLNTGCNKKKTDIPPTQTAPESPKEKNIDDQAKPESGQDKNTTAENESNSKNGDTSSQLKSASTESQITGTPKNVSFVNQYNGKASWNDLEKKYSLPVLKSKSDTSILDLSKKLDKNFYVNQKNTEEVACEVAKKLETSDGTEISFVTCIYADEEGDTTMSYLCDGEGEEGKAEDIYIGIRAKNDNTIRYYLYDTVAENCTREGFWSTDYSYALEEVYTSDFMDTNAIHVIISISSDNNDCEHEREVSGTDCRDNVYNYVKDHLIFVGKKSRFIGNYVEYSLTKGTKADCFDLGCPEFLDAEITHYTFTLKDNQWEYIKESGSVKIDSFSSETEVDKMDNYAKEGEWDKVDTPKVLPELKPYLQYAKNNPLMDIHVLKKFYTKGEMTQKKGVLDGNKLNLPLSSSENYNPEDNEVDNSIECTNNDQCLGNKICIDQHCKYQCKNNSDCLGEEACIHHQCLELKRDKNASKRIVFGHYEQDNDTTNGKEPISWRILAQNTSGQYLIISEKVLDVRPYHDILTDVTWEKSTIRSWLNGTFFDTAFTAAEKSKIISYFVPADNNPNHDTSPGNDTTDKIFLLSISEANEFFRDEAQRQASATHYAVKQNANVVGLKDDDCTKVDCSAFWWLRSPGEHTNEAAFVHQEGYFTESGESVNDNEIGVRPALWIQQ